MFIGSVITAYIIVVSSLYFFQEKLLFVPSKLDSSYEFQIKEVEEVKIPVNGATLSALYYKKENSNGLVFFLHGNAGNLSTWLTDTSFYERINYDLLMIDYRGYGKSTGEIKSEEEFLDDIVKAYEYIAPKYVDKKIVVYGRSLGSSLAAFISEKYNPAATILVSPFYNLDKMRKHYYSWVPKFAMRYQLDTAKYIKNIKNKTMILHGKEDEVIPPEQAELLKSESKSVDLVWIPQASHNDIHAYPMYQETISSFLKNL